ncbi:LytR family transcriptional regulator [Mesobacillus maritimus]|uniref:LytR family transcriptional regulator n=1 Tax=Mesobacillus maritimus TaxID=1643336 RepID=UPI00384AF457
MRNEDKIKEFDKFPKSVKKTLRYINQDVNSIEQLEEVEKVIKLHINKKKLELKKGNH